MGLLQILLPILYLHNMQYRTNQETQNDVPLFPAMNIVKVVLSLYGMRQEIFTSIHRIFFIPSSCGRLKYSHEVKSTSNHPIVID